MMAKIDFEEEPVSSEASHSEGVQSAEIGFGMGPPPLHRVSHYDGFLAAVEA